MTDWPRGALPGRFQLGGSKTHEQWVFELREYPSLPENLLRQLATITPSTIAGQHYWPVQLSLMDGRTLDRVVLMTPSAYMSAFLSPWPELTHDGLAVAASEIVKLQESPTRLTPRLVDKVVATMSAWCKGAFVYELVMGDGSRWRVMAAAFLDFTSLPPGKTSDEIVDVADTVDLVAEVHPVERNWWCLAVFDDGPGAER